MISRALVVLLVAGALAPAIGTFPSAQAASSGGIGIRLGEAPTSRRDDPRARIYVIDHVAPGASFSRKLVVTNDSPKPVDVALYPAAADITKGGFAPGPGHAVNELTTWTKVSQSSIKLAAGANTTVEATISVPPKASSGERYAVIWAEVSSGATSGVRQVNRVGVRVYLSVGPGGEPPSDFTIDTLTANRLPDGSPVVYALVHNTGGRALDMSGSLKLANGPGGLSAGPFTAKLGTTLGVKDTEPVTVLLDKALPAGPWKASIELVSGLNKRGAQATITFPAVEGAGTPVTTTPLVQKHGDSSGLPLVPIAGTAGGIGLLGLLFFLLSRRQKPAKRAKHSR
ncbi:MAG: hypothetical protein JWO12_2385 [Frankiales bacterium]|nr:hypothetical protein [Frankiales bacterium]